MRYFISKCVKCKRQRASSGKQLPPPCDFQRADVYLRKRWRLVQYLANLFWTRWRKEYLHTLQARTKWNHPQSNLEPGDIVLAVNENCARNDWLMARVISVKSVQNSWCVSQLLRPHPQHLSDQFLSWCCCWKIENSRRGAKLKHS